MKGDLTPKIILKEEEKGLILTVDFNAQFERFTSEQLYNHINIVILRPEKQDPSDKRQWAYSRLGSQSLFTTYLGHDYNGSIDRLKIYRSGINPTSHMKIEHVCAHERLTERHIERISGREVSFRREIKEEEALHEYYKLAQLLYLCKQ